MGVPQQLLAGFKPVGLDYAFGFLSYYSGASLQSGAINKMNFSTLTSSTTSIPTGPSDAYVNFSFDALRNGVGVFAGGYISNSSPGVKNSDMWGIILSTSTYIDITATLRIGFVAGGSLVTPDGASGYATGGGQTGNQAIGINSIDKFNLSTYARSTISATCLAPLDVNGGYCTLYEASAHNQTNGYLFGGKSSLSGACTSQVCSLLFSNETTSLTTAMPSAQMFYSMTQNKNATYIWGMLADQVTVQTPQKFIFSTQTYSTFTGASTSGYGVFAGRGISNNAKGFHSAGSTGAGAGISITLSYLRFDTETVTTGVSTGYVNNSVGTNAAITYVGQHIQSY
jgi:hypothetical protein